MPRLRKRTLLIAIPAALAALVLAACGSSDSSSTSSDSSSTTSVEASTAATGGASAGTTDGVVDLAANDNLDGQKILVDSAGRSLYLFEADTSGDASACNDDCATAWPPLPSKGAVKAGDGVDGDLLSTLKRDDGTTQVAYNGHPLYYYAGDTAPGDANGNDVDQFGAEWYAMNAAGDSIGDDEGESGESSSDDDSGSAEDSDSSTTEDSSSSDDSSSGGVAAGGY